MGKRFVLVGWDGADWSVINPLLDQGKMPNLARLIESGVMADLATLYPVLSPMIWTSIATGKRPYKHGIHGFTEPAPNRAGVQAVTNLSRKTRAIWNMLQLKGLKSNIVGWWPSHPAEPISGVMVSNHYQRATRPVDDAWPVLPGTIHPPRLIEPLANLRLHPQELTAEHVGPFVPSFGAIDQDKDRRLQTVAKILAECTSIHAATTALMQLEPWDFMAVYYDAIDHFCHGFMRYHPPRMPGVSDDDFALFSGVVESAYRYHDMMLGTLLDLLDQDATIMLVSDHGFHAGALRPHEIPHEPAGPAVEHRDYGIFLMAGPGIRQDERLYGASVLDIAPTILYAMGLPIGEDMDGTPLVNAFTQPHKVEVIPSWDRIEGDDGSHPSDQVTDPSAAAEAVRQLVELGYIEPLNDDVQTAIEETKRENDFNLARSYICAMRYSAATPILERLYERWPFEHRFGSELIRCLQNLAKTDDARAILERLKENTQLDVKNAHIELENRLKQHPISSREELSAQQQQELRALRSRCRPNPMHLMRLEAVQLLIEGDHAQALALFEHIQIGAPKSPIPLLGIGEARMKLRHWKESEDAFAAAIELDPGFVQARLGLCRCKIHQRRYKEAAVEALNALGLNYQLPMAHFFFGFCLARMRYPGRAVEALKTALSLNPRYAAAHRLLAHLYERQLDDAREAALHRNEARKAQTRQQRLRFERLTEGLPVEDEDAGARKPVASGQEALDDSSLPRRIEGSLRENVIVVSGLPRSGTSMMMQMLAAGGVPICSDGQREPDEYNRNGYYEDERVKSIFRSNQWLTAAVGQAVKIVAPLLGGLPPVSRLPYGVVLMERDVGAVVDSQARMLSGQGRDGGDLSRDQLMDVYARQVQQVKRMLAARRIPVLRVQYADCLRHPMATAERVAAFLGGEIDVERMASVVDPALQHVDR